MSVSYPTPTVLPTARYRPPSGETAETLVLVALILQVIGGVLVLAAISWLFGFSILYPYPFAWAAVTASAAVVVLILVFLYFAYTTSYRRIREGNYRGAETPTLVIGIISLFLGVLPGIFYLIGYLKLGDAIHEQVGPAYGVAPRVAPPTVTPPTAGVACPACGRVHPVGAYQFCPNCGQKLGA